VAELADLEVRTERDTAIALFPSSFSGDVLRVHCRVRGTRRWSRFLLVPDEGEGYAELEAKAPLAAHAYLHRDVAERTRG
jgi:hypothetical protein